MTTPSANVPRSVRNLSYVTRSEARKPLAKTPRLETLEQLRECCKVDGDHWLWRRGFNGRGRPTAAVNGNIRCGALITAMVLGREDERKPHQRWVSLCGIAECISPVCLRLRTHKEAHAIAARAGRLRRSPASRLRSTIAVNADPRRAYPAWMVDWAIESPQSTPAVAHALGVSDYCVRCWRNGTSRTLRNAAQEDLSASPFAMMVAQAVAS